MSNQAIVSQLSTKSQGLNFQEPILVRGHFGSSWQPILLRPLAQSPKQDKLISSILSGKAEDARLLLEQELNQKSTDTNTWLRQFFIDAGLGNIAALIYERICYLDLVDIFEANETIKSQLNSLRSRAAFSVLEWNRLNENLELIINKLNQYDCLSDCLFLKGTSLSRSLYKKPYHRLSCDFDLLTNSKKSGIVLKALAELGFLPFVSHPGFCQQYGVGPTRSLDDLFLVPSPELEGCHNLTLVKENSPYIEIKFNPLETGLTMIEAERVFAQSIKVGKEAAIWAPNPIDHLLIELPHLHKHGLQGWSWLYDIHLLVEEINKEQQVKTLIDTEEGSKISTSDRVEKTGKEANWHEFIRRCKVEGIEHSCWAGLALAKDRLGTMVPDTVLEELYSNSVHGPQTYAISTEFIWNCNSLPILLLNALWHGNKDRKFKALKESFLPSKDFLQKYYQTRQTETNHDSWYQHIWHYLVHLLVLILPAGVIRHSIGKQLFSNDRTSFKT